MNKLAELPTLEQVKECFANLTMEKVKVEEGEPLIWNSPQAFTGATYKNREGKITGGAVVDIAFAAYSGSSLTVTPANLAKQMVDQGVLETHIVEAFQEVMNILAGLFNNVSSEHLVLKSAFPHRKKAPDAEKKKLAGMKEGRHYLIEIPGYGEARLSLYRI